MGIMIENLQKNYRDQVILRNINLTVETGQFFTLFGRSGSGKTTLLKIIAGLEIAQTGIITVDEHQIDSVPAEMRDIGYIFQRPALFPHLTVAQNIVFGLKVRKVKKSVQTAKLQELLALLQLEGLADCYPHQLSGGQQQRVALGRALAIQPKVLLLDEPFTGLEAQLRLEMGALVKQLQQQFDLTVILVTHSVDECFALSDAVALLDEGTIIQSGSTAQVYYQPESVVAAKLLGKINVIPTSVFAQKIDSQQQIGTKQQIFIRPEQLQLIADSDGEWSITQITQIGKTKLVTCVCEDVTLEIEVANRSNYDQTQRYRVTSK